MLVAVPVVAGNALLGMLAVIYRHHIAALTPAECILLKAIAGLTGLVCERERLLQEQAEAHAQTLVLQETNRRFNEFLCITSHELKSPLTAMESNIQFAQRALRRHEQNASSPPITEAPSLPGACSSADPYARSPDMQFA